MKTDFGHRAFSAAYESGTIYVLPLELTITQLFQTPP